MGNKFSFNKNNKLDVQKTIEQINKDQIDHKIPDYIEDDIDDDEYDKMIASRYEDKDKEESRRERERENENAFNEIHVAFFKIDLKKYLDFINYYIDKPESYYKSLNLEEFIENKFFTYIDSKFDEPLKSHLKSKFEKILNKLFQSECYRFSINKWRILLGKTIDYVFKQDDKFITTYIITFINDTYDTYKDGLDNVSCAEGIVERFVTIVSSVLEVLCITNADCTDQKSIELYKILTNTIDINEFTQQWAIEHLDTNAIQSMNKEDRKKHFIEFVEYQYALKKKQSLTKIEIDNILKYANDLDSAGIFERGYFGGKKAKKIKKKSIKKNKRQNLKKSKKRK
jgi:hypothetical protein